jgi:PAT family beta-lactamase induction signal transducer AmpG
MQYCPPKYQEQCQDQYKLMTTLLLLGFASGVPFLLILSTLSAWLTEVGVSKTTIGCLSWVSVPYALKFVWSKYLDEYRLPWLYAWLGQRRSWMLLSQSLLFFAVLALALARPAEQLWYLICCCLCVGLCSATQDIVVEAYRIESLQGQQLGLGTSCSVLGYRLGMLCSGAGALYIAAYSGSWVLAYVSMAVAILLGIFATLYLADSTFEKPLGRQAHDAVSPLNMQNWKIILLFIICFKSSDTVIHTMSMPFLLELGFSKLIIAHVAKTFGIIAMIFGSMVAGWIVYRYSLVSLLTSCLCLQMLVTAGLVAQSLIGDNVSWLFVTMGLENFSCGLNQVALLIYFSKLCAWPHTCVQYAILSSLASFVRIYFAMVSGWLADHIAWHYFYGLVGLAVVPGIVLLLSNFQHFKQLE